MSKVKIGQWFLSGKKGLISYDPSIEDCEEIVPSSIQLRCIVFPHLTIILLAGGYRRI
jgi:hypothetical protein